jgi:hypothetical protein
MCTHHKITFSCDIKASSRNKVRFKILSLSFIMPQFDYKSKTKEKGPVYTGRRKGWVRDLVRLPETYFTWVYIITVQTGRLAKTKPPGWVYKHFLTNMKSYLSEQFS